MKLKNSFFVLALFAFSFCFISFSEAQGTPPAGGNPSIMVATVNVQNIELVQQAGNSLTLSFIISNREGVQPEVIYAVTLLKKGNDNTLSKIDQKIFSNDILSFGINESVKKQITYTAPSYLKGSYYVMVEAKNRDGLPFGMVTLSEPIILNGTNEYIGIDESSCFITVDGEAGNKQYVINQGVDISPKETLTAHCAITSTFKTAQTVTPVFETHYRTAFGKVTGVEKMAPITLTQGEKKEFTAVIPKTTEPQAYDANLSFVTADTVSVSPTIPFHYVLQGLSATIQNLRLDKDFYRAGETAKFSFFWSKSADGFPGSRGGGSDEGKTVSVVFSMNDDQGNVCASPLTKKLEIIGLEEVPIHVTADCKNPVVSAKITDEAGKVLAENGYDITSKSVLPTMTNPIDSNVKMAFYVLILLVAIGLAFYLVKRNKKTDVAMMLGLLIGLSVLVGGKTASADTFYTIVGTWDHYIITTYVVNIDKSVYYPGEPIIATGYVSYWVCSNGATGGGSTLTVGINNDAQQNVANMTILLTAPMRVANNHVALFIGSGAGKNRASIPFAVVDRPKAKGVCGTADGKIYPHGTTSYGTDTQCKTSGESTNKNFPESGTTINWKCPGTNGGGLSNTCTASQLGDATTGQCGNANAKTFLSTDTKYDPYIQCANGNSNNIKFPIKGGTETWVCQGISGGLNSGACSASRQATPVTNNDGVCGSADQKIYGSTETGYGSDEQCFAGTPSNTDFPKPNKVVTWICSGRGSGYDSPSCSARTMGQPINGTCGIANGKTQFNPPNMAATCATGAPSGISTTVKPGFWTWTCSGQLGGSASPQCSTKMLRPTYTEF